MCVWDTRYWSGAHRLKQMKNSTLLDSNVPADWSTLFKNNETGRQFNQQTMRRPGDYNTEINVLCN